MKYLLATLLVLSAAGCVMTPQQIVDEGPRTTLSSALAPQELALCLIRNAEAKSAVIFGQYRPGKIDGTIEVIIRAGGQGPDTVAVANIYSTKNGSEATMWLSPHIFGGHERYAKELMMGC